MEHWDTFYTDDIIKSLAERGVEIIRLPIGDWTLDPYGPYVGCTEGAAAKIDWFYDTCAKYNIKVLMDVHAMKDSQNGYDNSGKQSNVEWLVPEGGGDPDTFTHWPLQAANWYGDWNTTTLEYEHINYSSVNWGLKVHEHLLQRWGSHSAFYAFEPINEPQFHRITPVLQDFYKRSRKLVQRYTANAWFVFHNGDIAVHPRVWNSVWRDDDMDHIAMDMHFYEAWQSGFGDTSKDACDYYETYVSTYADRVKYPVWVGEWSLATDVCAHWLGGFNDGKLKAQMPCNKVECPHSYMKQYVVDVDRTAAGPLGPKSNFEYVDDKCISGGMCNSDSCHYSDTIVKEIARCALDTWDRHVNATFLWTARNEIEAKWDYRKAWDLGWINKTEVPKEQMLDYANVTGCKPTPPASSAAGSAYKLDFI